MNGTVPLVTIIMPAYNVEDFIVASIESVLQQTISNFELIIINDGSTDSTLKIVEKYSALDSRITLITQRNSGVSIARNYGLRVAKGDYISFLDADDIYEQRYIELMVEPLVSGRADMAFCKYWETDRDTVIAKTPANVVSMHDDSFIKHLFAVDKVHNMALMYNRRSLERHNLTFLEGCPNGEDRMFILKASYFLRVEFVPEYLYRYIYRYNSACRAELSYERLFLMLDGYLNLDVFFHESIVHTEKEFFIQYVGKEIVGVKNDLRRKIWGDLQDQNFDQVEDILIQYKYRYGEVFNVPYTGFKRFTLYPKMKIIQSQNKKLWKKIFKK